VRVISGKARGLRLESPDGLETRPTLDRVKESVFNMIAPYLSGAVVLDLFAGTGALGIEALSRGSEKVYFIDNASKAIECITKNITSAKFSDNSCILKSSADFFLKNTDIKFDLIFIDPPYSSGLYSETLSQIVSAGILTDDGIIIVEWDQDTPFYNTIEGLIVLKEKKYGRVGITLLKKN